MHFHNHWPTLSNLRYLILSSVGKMHAAALTIHLHAVCKTEGKTWYTISSEKWHCLPNHFRCYIAKITFVILFRICWLFRPTKDYYCISSPVGPALKLRCPTIGGWGIHKTAYIQLIAGDWSIQWILFCLTEAKMLLKRMGLTVLQRTPPSCPVVQSTDSRQPCIYRPIQHCSGVETLLQLPTPITPHPHALKQCLRVCVCVCVRKKKYWLWLTRVYTAYALADPGGTSFSSVELPRIIPTKYHKLRIDT